MFITLGTDITITVALGLHGEGEKIEKIDRIDRIDRIERVHRGT